MPNHDRPDYDSHPDGGHYGRHDSAVGPTSHGPDGPWPSDRLPTLEQDLSVVAWLQCSRQLSPEATGLLCDALLQWALLGGDWPDPAEPVAGPDCDHLEALVQLIDRWLQRAQAEPIGRRLELAHVGRGLATAVACQRDPQALADRQWREMVSRQPWLAGPPVPCVLPDGRVL